MGGGTVNVTEPDRLSIVQQRGKWALTMYGARGSLYRLIADRALVAGRLNRGERMQ